RVIGSGRDMPVATPQPRSGDRDVATGGASPRRQPRTCATRRSSPPTRAPAPEGRRECGREEGRRLCAGHGAAIVSDGALIPTDDLLINPYVGAHDQVDR